MYEHTLICFNIHVLRFVHANVLDKLLLSVHTGSLQLKPTFLTLRSTDTAPSTIKGKGSFYIAQYPVHWTAQSASHCLPSLTDLFIPTPFSASPGSILARQQLRAKTKSLTFPPLSVARYSFIQLSRQERQRRERKMPNLRNGSKGDSNPGSLDCESGILPLSYCAPPYTIQTLYRIQLMQDDLYAIVRDTQLTMIQHRTGGVRSTGSGSE